MPRTFSCLLFGSYNSIHHLSYLPLLLPAWAAPSLRFVRYTTHYTHHTDKFTSWFVFVDIPCNTPTVSRRFTRHYSARLPPVWLVSACRFAVAAARLPFTPQTCSAYPVCAARAWLVWEGSSPAQYATLPPAAVLGAFPLPLPPCTAHLLPFLYPSLFSRLPAFGMTPYYSSPLPFWFLFCLRAYPLMLRDLPHPITLPACVARLLVLCVVLPVLLPPPATPMPRTTVSTFFFCFLSATVWVWFELCVRSFVWRTFTLRWLGCCLVRFGHFWFPYSSFRFSYGPHYYICCCCPLYGSYTGWYFGRLPPTFFAVTNYFARFGCTVRLRARIFPTHTNFAGGFFQTSVPFARTPHLGTFLDCIYSFFCSIRVVYACCAFAPFLPFRPSYMVCDVWFVGVLLNFTALHRLRTSVWFLFHGSVALRFVWTVALLHTCSLLRSSVLISILLFPNR